MKCINEIFKNMLLFNLQLEKVNTISPLYNSNNYMDNTNFEKFTTSTIFILIL
jgi:hypothetical protein